MRLYHYIQFHRHVIVWAVCALIVVLTAITAGKTSLTSAQDSSTKDFFGNDSEEIVQFDQITECKKGQDKISTLVAKEKSLYADSSKVINELDTLTVKFAPTESEKIRINELKVQHTKIEADLATNKAELQSLSNKTGPSDECKTAFVKAILKNMSKHSEKLPGYVTKLDRISEVMVKIENALPELKKSSTNETLIKSIEDDIVTINASIKTLKAFFTEMQTEMTNFISLANSNPVAAYDEMNKLGRDETRFKKIEGVAETMTAALSRLKSSLDTLIISTSSPN